MEEISSPVAKNKEPITINDVAKLAKVSKSTVSKVLNEQDGISEKTREKVLATMEKLNYHPSMVAKSLKSRKTKAIGLMLPSITNPVFPTILKGVEDTALENGYVIVFCNSDEKIEKESLYFEIFKNRWVDGIIFSVVTGNKEEESYIRAIYEKGTPVVLIDREIDGYFANVVMIDNKKSAFDATTHLLELNHRKIGCITGPLNIKMFAKRLQGYRKALAEYGIEFNEDLVKEADLTIKGGSLAVKELLSQKELPTAIFACNDFMAIGAIKELQRNGLKVPNDVSVIGFDDIPLASLVTPSLTTIAQPLYEMGVEAMNLLMRLMEKKGASRRKILLDTQLVIRDSTSKPKV